VYGLDATIDRAITMMELFDWDQWPNFYPVNFVRVPSAPLSPVIETEALRVLASPVDHLIPTFGLRFEFRSMGKVLAYSCDTQPCPAVEQLARGADLLIHEATGASKGHTSPAQAGEIAQRAGVKTLYLIHYPPQAGNYERLMAEARQSFGGKVLVATDFLRIAFD
jgi:ribonuclease Z